MTGDEVLDAEIVPVDLDQVLGDFRPAAVVKGDRCEACGRSAAGHWNPGGRRRWDCAEIREIEASCGYWSKPWWRRVWQRRQAVGR